MNNPTPIPGSVNEKGLFTAKNNPIVQSEYAKDKWCYPQLLTYTQSNVLVTDEEHVEVVGPVVMVNAMTRNGYNVWTQVWPLDGITCTKQEMIDDANKNDVEYRECYITIPPTEKEENLINVKATLIKDIELFFKKGDHIVVLKYHNDFGGYEVKNSYGATTYVYRNAFLLN